MGKKNSHRTEVAQSKKAKRQERACEEAESTLSRLKYFWICCVVWVLGGGYLTWFGVHMKEDGTVRVGAFVLLGGLIAVAYCLKKTLTCRRLIAEMKSSK